jgi:hypothetical protein
MKIEITDCDDPKILEPETILEKYESKNLKSDLLTQASLLMVKSDYKSAWGILNSHDS